MRGAEVRKARRAYEMQALKSQIAENERRLEELRRQRSEPCPLCARLSEHRAAS